MENEVDVTQEKMDMELSNSLKNATSIITKDYLDRLETYDLVDLFEKDRDVDLAKCGRFFKLTKLVLNREENFLNKLTTIVNVASSIDCSLATIIRSDGYRIDFYLGIVSKSARGDHETDRNRRTANAAAFGGALSGNLIGSELEAVTCDEMEYLQNQVLNMPGQCYSSVSGIVALRDKEDKSVDGYVQGIENLVDSLKGQKYTIVMLADPVDTAELAAIKEGYQMLHTQLSTFARSSVTVNESDSVTLSESRTKGISEEISEGITMTQSRSSSKGIQSGVSAGAGVNIGITANIGFSTGINSSTTEAESSAQMKQKSSQRVDQNTDGLSQGKTAGKSLQLNYENRSVRALLEKIDRHLERLEECESFGAFECAAYVIAETRETALTVASNYNALMRGQDSNVQASHINSWYQPEKTKILAQYISSLVHPRFYFYKVPEEESKNYRDPKGESKNNIIVTPASIISGNELAIQVGLPKKSISGITVIPMAPFGRNIAAGTGRALELGNLYHMGNDEGSPESRQRVKIDIESLAMHTFITGSTGAGKSRAIYSMLDKLMKEKVSGKEDPITFLVIEPAKGEYKDRFGSYPNVKVYGTNYKKTPLLKINPFSFPDDIHVLEHIDRLIEIFNVCWPMYAAMPAVLKDAVENAYIVSGWNLNISECRYRDARGRALYPSFGDVLKQVNRVMEDSSYSADTKGDYKGALCTRLKSLTNGLFGQIFTSDELTGEELFDQNVIVDLSRMRSSESQSLIMGLLVMKLQEHRTAYAQGQNAPLRHVTVLEEAHNLLKQTSTEQSGETANVQGKSVEMLANSIAEMRTYGEGFVIADQAPGLMDMSVIRNTNTKIILRLPDMADRELVGHAANLNDDQILELSRLKTFVAAVYQNNWLEPVLCNIDVDFKAFPMYKYKPDAGTESGKMNVIKYLLSRGDRRDQLDQKYIDRLIEIVYRLPISTEAKIAFANCTKATDEKEVERLSGQVLYQLFNSETAFSIAEEKKDDMDHWFRCMKEVLEPNITIWSEDNQIKLIVSLELKRMRIMHNSADAKDICDNFLLYLRERRTGGSVYGF